MRWAAGGSRWSPTTRSSTTTCSRTRAARPRVCFLGTASGDSLAYIEKFYRAFSQRACEPTHVMLFNTPPADFVGIVASQDVIYVGGGSTRNLLVLWRTWGIDRALRRVWRRGAVLCGVSAGALCWFASGVSDSVSPRLAPIDALGFLGGSMCPHYDGEADRRPAYHRMIARGALPAGYAADDGAALHFVGRRLHRVVTSRPAAHAYHLSRRGGAAIERLLPSVYLCAGEARGLSGRRSPRSAG